MSPKGLVLEAWQHTCRDVEGSFVVPDGCRDVIAWALPGQPTEWKLSPLMDQAAWVAGASGKRYQGFRLKPGVVVQTQSLLNSLSEVDALDTERVLDRLHHFAREDQRVTDALQALAEKKNLAQARRALGVSERSLERLLRQATGRAPTYWRRLARFRQTMRDLMGHIPLAQLAADAGFADQAHLNRECRLWMNLTPAQLRRHPPTLRLLNEAGYA